LSAIIKLATGIITLRKLVKIFRELFQEKKNLKKLYQSDKLLLIIESLNRFIAVITWLEEHFVLLKFEFFPSLEDVSLSDTFRLKLIDYQEPSFEKLVLALMLSSHRLLNTGKADESETQRFSQHLSIRGL